MGFRYGLPDVSSSDRGSMSHTNGCGMGNSNWGGVSNGNWGGVGHSGNWDGHLGLNWLAVLLRNLLGHSVTINSLLQVAGGDWHGLGDLLGGVDADLLGHLAAVRLDSCVGSGHSSRSSHYGWGGMSHHGWGSSMGHKRGSNSMAVKTSWSPGLSLGLSLPLDNVWVDQSMWTSTDLGSDLLALLLESHRLLHDILGVAHLLSLRNTVLSLNFLKSDGALRSGHGVNSRGHSNMSKAVASVMGVGIGVRGRGSIGHSGGKARIGDKLVHGDLDVC